MDRELYLEFCDDNLPIERGVYPKEVPGGFVNLSGVSVPCEVAIILSFGPNFIPPHKASSMDVVGVLSDLYADCVHAGGTDVGGQYYREVYHHYKNCFDELINAFPPSFSDRIIGHMLNILVHFLQSDKSLVVVQADKGRCTVLMKLHEYNERMAAWVEKCKGQHIYECIPETKVHGLMRGVEGAYKHIYNKFVDEYNRLPKQIKLLFSKVQKGFDHLNRGSSVRIPYLYGIIKRHKEGYPIRPICATLHWWAQPIQKAIVICLKKACANMLLEANVTGGVESARLIHTKIPGEGYVFIKLDITDMYTSMPAYKIIGVIKGWLRNPVFAKKCIFSRELILTMLHFSLEFSSYLACDGVVYKQTKGLPQGASDSGLLATIYLDWLLGIHLYSIFYTNSVALWLKYVDDFLILLPARNIDRFRDAFEYFTGLSVTLEYEEVSSNGMYISFLDVDIWRCGGRVYTGVHRKPIASMRTVHYMSAHSEVHKRNTLREYIRKVLNISSNELLPRDLGNIVKTFENNSYPYEYIATQMRYVLCAEIGRLKVGGKTFCKLNVPERIENLYSYLSGFSPYIMLPSLKQCYALSNRLDKKTRCVPIAPLHVMPFRYDALTSLIRAVYKFNGFIGTPVFRIKDHNLSRLLRMSLSGKDPVYDAIVTEKIFMFFCAECNYSIIVSGAMKASVLVETLMSSSSFPLRVHYDVTGHTVNVRAVVLNTSNDRQIGLQMSLYQAIYQLMGFHCDSTEVLMKLPRILTRFLWNVRNRDGHFPLPLLSSKKVLRKQQLEKSHRSLQRQLPVSRLSLSRTNITNINRSETFHYCSPPKRLCPTGQT